MIKWPSKAASAIQHLFRPLQDIDVYIEDTGDEPLYKKLLNFATGGQVKIARVFALNGCVNVTNAAKSHNWANRKALFLIDGDLAWVKGEEAEPVKGLHRLNCYCMENLLFCSDALTKIVSEELAIEAHEASARLGLSTWSKSISSPLLELFAAYATLHKYDSTIPTVSNKVGGLCTQTPSTSLSALDPIKVSNATKHCLSLARAKAGPPVDNTYNEIVRRLQSLPDHLMIPSGKDYLLPLFQLHLNSINCKVKTNSLRHRLSEAGRVERLNELRTALLSVAR